MFPAHVRGMTSPFKGVPLKDLDPASLTLAIAAEAARIPTLDQGAVMEAMTVASFLHRNQTRANRKTFERTPYIEHPLHVDSSMKKPEQSLAARPSGPPCLCPTGADFRYENRDG